MLFCDQPYERNHKCPLKQTQLFIVEIPGEDESDEDGVVESEPNLNTAIENLEPYISDNALTDVCDKRSLHILIDSGSTHNFLYVDIAKKLAAELTVFLLKQ